MKPLTPSQLTKHVRSLQKVSQDDLDDFLQDLLERCYPTMATQNS